MIATLSKKFAIVCGSTQGIGKAIAVELANQGANITLMARNEEKLIEVQKELPASDSQRHDHIVADFNTPEDVESKISEYIKNNKCHILVNNSGGPSPGAIINAKTDEFILAFNRHLICNHILTLALFPSMKKSGYGRIINIISTSVKEPITGLGVSNTIRGAVASWAKTMASELGEFNITVNNILPGSTNTKRLQSLISHNAEKKGETYNKINDYLTSGIPLNRFAEPDEIAKVVAFIASPSSSYINGINIPVDGGRTGSL